MSSYWFIPLIVESILLLILIAYESGILSTLSIVATAVVVHFGFVNLIDVASNNWKGILFGFLGYVVAGTLWAFAKWALYVINKRDEYKEAKAKFINNFDTQLTYAQKNDKEYDVKAAWERSPYN